MRWFYKLPLRLRSLFCKNEAELDLSEELQFHLQNQTDEYVAKGMDPEEARHAAFRSLGGVEQVKEECREARKMNLVENFARDMRQGLRMLRRNPGFTVLTILCLTLGIGANAAVFSWVEGLLLRPYPLVSHQERLVALSGTGGEERDQTSWPDLLDVKRSCTLCETVFGRRASRAIQKSSARRSDWITSCTPSSGSCPRGSTALSSAGSSSSGCPCRCWKLSMAVASNSRIAARAGRKRMRGSSLA